MTRRADLNRRPVIRTDRVFTKPDGTMYVWHNGRKRWTLPEKESRIIFHGKANTRFDKRQRRRLRKRETRSARQVKTPTRVN